MIHADYIIKFGVPYTNGQIFFEDTLTSEDCQQFEEMKNNGTIIDYEIDNIGIKIIIEE
jgi:hypothetical protein